MYEGLKLNFLHMRHFIAHLTFDIVMSLLDIIMGYMQPEFNIEVDGYDGGSKCIQVRFKECKKIERLVVYFLFDYYLKKKN